MAMATIGIDRQRAIDALEDFICILALPSRSVGELHLWLLCATPATEITEHFPGVATSSFFPGPSSTADVSSIRSCVLSDI
jgi:hypothetical protein